MRTSQIFNRYFLGLSFVVAGSVIVFGAIETGLRYVENMKRLTFAQASEIRFAESKIISFLRNIELQVAEVSQLPWDRGLLDRVVIRSLRSQKSTVSPRTCYSWTSRCLS